MAVIGNALIVRTKVESFFRSISLIMPLLFASDDKPREAYHFPLRIDAVSHYYTFVYIFQYPVCIALSSHISFSAIFHLLLCLEFFNSFLDKFIKRKRVHATFRKIVIHNIFPLGLDTLHLKILDSHILSPFSISLWILYRTAARISTETLL